jgi:hypothetical protein
MSKFFDPQVAVYAARHPSDLLSGWPHSSSELGVSGRNNLSMVITNAM